jgi:AcrR family transcriptional regulator
MESKQYHHGDLKAELIQKGLEILDREGIKEFSLRKVAKACGVSQTAPYRHFISKDELITEIVFQAMRAFNDSLASAAEKHPDSPADQIREMGVAYVRFFADNPQYLRLLFLSSFPITSAEACNDKAHFKEGHPFATFFKAIQRYKETSPDDPRDIGELLVFCWGLVHGIAVLAAGHDLPLQYDVCALAEKVIWNTHFI